jgi:hypothetical protein
MIYWPDYGHIWHVVTDVAARDYNAYVEHIPGIKAPVETERG